MSDNLEAAAAALGIPAPLAQRAAAARATESGTSVEEVLAAWAGGGSVASSAPAETPATAEPAPEPAPTVEAEAPAAPTPAATPEPAAVPAAAAAMATPAPTPTEVTAREAAHLPEVITVPTAGLRERTSSNIPRWLTAMMIVIPFLALFALGQGATGQCGSSTELAVDVVTGQVVDCDGSEFTGRESGGGGSDFVALGEQIYQGTAVAGVQCFGCHGANGQGAGTFPAMTGVLTTFGSCADHMEWVHLGTAGFQAAGRTTYGDTGKAVGGAGNMPAFAGSLSDEQIAAVVAFERVRFGGGDPEAVLIDCGLAEGEGGGEEGGEEGEGTEGSADDGATEGSDAEAILGRRSS